MKAVQSNLDRRAFGRRETQISANIRVGYRIQPCIIKDISEGGALLEFPEDVELPQRLWLSWSDMPNEIVCEVRHVRRNRAGVEFARPISLAMKATAVPAGTIAAQPAVAPRQVAELLQGPSAADIVAQRRNALRRPGVKKDIAPEAWPGGAQAGPPAPPIAAVLNQSVAAIEPAAEPPELPRDALSILFSMHAELARQAASIIAARIDRCAPMPLAASAYETLAVPAPLPARAYAILERDEAPAAVVSLEIAVPMPLAASAYARVTPLARVTPPLPLPARAYRGP